MVNRFTLRDITARAHMQAEARWLVADAFPDRARYDAWLRAMYDLHLSQGLPSAHSLNNPDLCVAEADRLAALTSDLGLPPLRGLQGQTPAMSSDRAWGIQYVLNGSAMGAAKLLKSGAVNPDWPNAYLTEMARFAKLGGLKLFFDRLNDLSIDMTVASQGAEEVFLTLA